MENVLKGLEPAKVFEYFEKISAIPRGSGNTDNISAFCEKFALERGLRCIREDCGNIIIFKNAQGRNDSAEPVIIQGHLDMVWEKDADCDIDFSTEGLRLRRNDKYIYAESTTLGGDDGIAVAMGLALLDDNNIPHPPLEVVFTVDEEVGMSGARSLDTSVLKGKRLLNLDSEEEGTILAGCAGGQRTDFSLSCKINEKASKYYNLSVMGLHGGHSGAEIHMGYANANKVIGSILFEFDKCFDIRLVSLNGGTMDNAITREAFAVFGSDDFDIAKAELICNKISSGLLSREPGIEVKITRNESENMCCNSEDSSKIISMLNEFPYGVMAMSGEIDGLVETSLNLGFMSTSEEGKFDFRYSVRSNINSEKIKLVKRLYDIAAKYGSDVYSFGEYPAWEFRKKSVFRDSLIEIFTEQYGKEPVVTVIHAGLECGLLGEKIKDLDAVSIGPDIIEIHTPRERLDIASVQRTWNYVLKILSTI